MGSQYLNCFKELYSLEKISIGSFHDIEKIESVFDPEKIIFL
jgi:hypothetical protein